MELKQWSKVLVLNLLLTAASAANAQFASDQALTEFVNRPTLGQGDITNWAASLPTLIGSYVILQDGGPKLVGQGKNTTPRPTQVDLKNRPVFHSLITSKSEVNVSVMGMFNLSRSKDAVDELNITDLISVTDPIYKSDDCTANTPNSFSESTKYWCISAITLSSIVNKKYKKVKKLGDGTYGVVTAGGTFESSSDINGTILSGSISVIGPFVNGKLVDTEPSKKIIKNAVKIGDASVNLQTKSIKDLGSTVEAVAPRTTGLEGEILKLK